jgi:hypothetical protein
MAEVAFEPPLQPKLVSPDDAKNAAATEDLIHRWLDQATASSLSERTRQKSRQRLQRNASIIAKMGVT